MQNIQPVDNRILIQLIIPEGSQIVIPEKVDAPFVHARILAVGSKVTNCKVGDKVMLMSEITIHPCSNKEKIGITTDSVVLAVISDEVALIS